MLESLVTHIREPLNFSSLGIVDKCLLGDHSGVGVEASTDEVLVGAVLVDDFTAGLITHELEAQWGLVLLHLLGLVVDFD